MMATCVRILGSILGGGCRTETEERVGDRSHETVGATVDAQAGAIHLDFSGSDDQTLGPVNVPPQYAEMATFYAVLGMAQPDLSFNDGVREAVTLTFREGSVLNPRMPAPSARPR
jgi:N-methylhydantoinase B/oxoprolinase/acetone carboxylase alpha subunit